MSDQPGPDEEFRQWRARQWPEPGKYDVGRRAPWLTHVSRGDFAEIARYIKAVLTGDDLVEPDVHRAEQAVSMLAGWVTGAGANLKAMLDDLEAFGDRHG